MKKPIKPPGTTKPAQKKPGQTKLATKSARLKRAQDGAGLAEVVAQLAVSAEKLAQAAERLAQATSQLSVTGQARHGSLETAAGSTADSTIPQQESEPADENNGE